MVCVLVIRAALKDRTTLNRSTICLMLVVKKIVPTETFLKWAKIEHFSNKWVGKKSLFEIHIDLSGFRWLNYVTIACCLSKLTFLTPVSRSKVIWRSKSCDMFGRGHVSFWLSLDQIHRVGGEIWIFEILSDFDRKWPLNDLWPLIQVIARCTDQSQVTWLRHVIITCYLQEE